MKKALSTMLCGAAAVVGVTLSGAAFAQGTWGASTTWNFGAPCNTPSCLAGGMTLNISGFGYDSRYSVNYAPGSITNQGDSSGLGFRSTNETTNSPNHAFDNRGGSNGYNYGATNEVLLLDFGSAKVNLTSIKTGWSENDTDVMVFRWDGAAAPTMTATAGPNGLIGAGWQLVSAKDLDGTNNLFTNDGTDRTFTLNTGAGYNAASDDKVSSWWLVSSYFSGANNGLAGVDLTGTKLGDSSSDYFKLLSFTGRKYTPDTPTPPTGVPEPASLALVGVALAGVDRVLRAASGAGCRSRHGRAVGGRPAYNALGAPTLARRVLRTRIASCEYTG